MTVNFEHCGTSGSVVDELFDVAYQRRHQLPVHHVHLAVMHRKDTHAPSFDFDLFVTLRTRLYLESTLTETELNRREWRIMSEKGEWLIL